MRRRNADFDRLVAELEADAGDLRMLLGENRRAMERIETGAVDRLDRAALGYTIHNLYGVMETYCLRIAKFFENGIGPDAWHRELLRRMTLAIADLRPAFLDDAALVLVDELRSFRHLFRNLYARPLDPERVGFVQGKVEPACGAFRAAHEAYPAKLRAPARAVD